MTNEQILNEISLVMKDNNKVKVGVNEALTHAANAIRKMEKERDAAYDDGLNDGVDLYTKLYNLAGDGGLPIKTIQDIYGCNVGNVMKQYTPKEALNKLREYESDNQKTVTDEIVRGDEVVCEASGSTIRGIYLGASLHSYWVVFPEDEIPQSLTKSMWILTKTGKHVDLGGGDGNE